MIGNQSNKKELSLAGYMSVEASCIIPMVVVLMSMIIYLSFFLYNRTILFQDTYALAFRTSRQAFSKDEMLNYVNERVDAQYGEKYIAASTLEKSCKVTSNAVSVEAKMSVRQPFGKMMGIAGNDVWQAQTTVNAKVINPTKTTRNIRTALRLADVVLGEE